MNTQRLLRLHRRRAVFLRWSERLLMSLWAGLALFGLVSAVGNLLGAGPRPEESLRMVHFHPAQVSPMSRDSRPESSSGAMSGSASTPGAY